MKKWHILELAYKKAENSALVTSHCIDLSKLMYKKSIIKQ